MIEFYTACLLTRRGGGKTTTMTALLKEYSDAGLNIYANYTLKGIPYTHIEPEDLADFPEWLHDGVVALDELHAKMDAYDFWKTLVKDNALFLTQTRKRRLIVLFTTQVWTQVPKRMRSLTDYIFQCSPIKDHDQQFIGVSVDVFDLTGIGHEYTNTFLVDALEVFKHFDTNEIIHRYDKKKAET